VKAAQPLIPKTAEAIQGIIWQQRMYTLIAADLYTGELAGGQPGSRSALDLFSQTSQIPCGLRCRLVFVVVAFPPPPVTFPATRLEAYASSDFGLLQG
jgi:hypothetical protein